MDQLSAHLDRAWDLVGRGDLTGALRSAEQSLEIDAQAPEVHNLMGYICAQEGRADEALEHYERALELDESFVEAMLNAAEVKLHPRQDWDGAITLVDEALGWIDDPEETADAILLKIDAMIGKGDRDSATATLRTLPDGPFESPSIMLSIGRARLELGDAAGAEPWLRQVIEKEPRSADAHYFLGVCLQERRDTRGAALAFLCSRDAELRSSRPAQLPQDDFERRVRDATAALPAHASRVVEGALVVVAELPGAEVVAEGVDPRVPILLDDVSPDGESPRAGRVFVYQRNVERAAGAEEVVGWLCRNLVEEIEHVFPELAKRPSRAPMAQGTSSQ